MTHLTTRLTGLTWLTGLTRRTPARRRTGLAATALALGLVLTACGGEDADEGDDAAPSGGESAQTEEPISEDQLEQALITEGDVPAGLTETESDDDEGEDDPFAGTCVEDLEELSDLPEFQEDVEAEREFGAEEEGAQASVFANLSTYPTADQLSGAMDTFVETLSGCTEVSTTDDDGLTLALTAATDEDVTVDGADQQINVTLDGTIGNAQITIPLTFELAFVRFDEAMANVGTFAVGDLTAAVDAHDDLVELQSGRLAELVG